MVVDKKNESGSKITEQMRRMGASVDWQREYFTMDPALSKSVTEVFVRLFEQGLIYRGKRLVNWDPVLKTAVSDLEVESVETEGHFCTMHTGAALVRASISILSIFISIPNPSIPAKIPTRSLGVHGETSQCPH